MSRKAIERALDVCIYPLCMYLSLQCVVCRSGNDDGEYDRGLQISTVLFLVLFLCVSFHCHPDDPDDHNELSPSPNTPLTRSIKWVSLRDVLLLF